MKILKTLLPLLLFVVLISCQSNKSNAPNQSIDFVPFSLKIAMNNTPANVFSIEGVLEKTGYNTITEQFVINNDTATAYFGDIVTGTWHLSVTAFDSMQNVIYFGETDVSIIAGIINTVYLQLDPITGSLVVVVTWGTTGSPGDEYIYMHTHDYSPKVIYRYNFQTSLLEQLTFENQTSYPIYISNINKIGYTNNSRAEYWIMDPNGQNKESLFPYPSFNINHQSFCSTTNKTYCYSIESSRKLVEMDYNSQNFRYLTDNNNDAYPEINFSGDSLLFHSDRNGTNNIFMLDLSTMLVNQITYNSEISNRPRWSPSKNGFYYHKTDSNGFANIMFYNFNNELSESIVDLNSLYIHAYCVAPDENEIALICSNSPSYTSGPQNLYVYDLATATLTQKTYANLLLTKPQWYQMN
jgi:hypothetical protein